MRTFACLTLVGLFVAACEREEPEIVTCGDGVQHVSEACDDGNTDDTDWCTNACTIAACGDGIVGPREECDDGNTDDGDACTNDCTIATCGDGVVGPGEECDDGNRDDGDLCTNACTERECGDGVLASNEECDDGDDNAPTGACLADCTRNVCGDGFTGPDEECDDGNDDDTDDCSSVCEHTHCGDGILGALEACDDGNEEAGDGCVRCEVTAGWTCWGGTECTCAEGYTGADCATCAPGYQDEDQDGTCLPSCELLAFEDADPCTEGVDHCAIVGGEPTCLCDDGLFDQGNGCAPLPLCAVYVSPEGAGTGDGSSWADATTDLQGAIGVAAGLAATREDASCEVWVQAGTYTVYAGSRDDTLQLATGVVVRGGFVGTENTAEERTFRESDGQPVHETILDGAGTSVHVVTAAPGATLDGVVVTGGFANQGRAGGGLFAEDAEGVTVSRTTFRTNGGDNGGAIGVVGGSLTVDTCLFHDNAVEWNGGAIHAWQADAVTIRDSSFIFNHNDNGHGGAVALVNVEEASVVGTSFEHNHTGWEGGALYALGTAFLDLEGCDFVANNSPVEPGCLGGAVYMRDATQQDVDEGRAETIADAESFVAVDSDFTDNHVRFEGGALYLSGIPWVELVDGEFVGNYAGPTDGSFGGLGGAVVGYDLGEVSLTGTEVAHNQTWGGGGGVYLEGADRFATTRVTFRGNDALTVSGGGAHLIDVPDVALRDTWFIDNGAHAHGGGLVVDPVGAFEHRNGGYLDNHLDGGGFGAALLLRDDAYVGTATLDDLTLVGNDSAGSGTVSAHQLARLSVTRTDFRDNRAEAGSGVYARRVRDIDLDRVAFVDNGGDRDAWGSALLSTDSETVDVVDSVFDGNHATALAGGATVCNGIAGGPSSTCDFMPNHESDDIAPPSTPWTTTATFVRTDFLDNTGASLGSALNAQDLAALVLEDVTMAGNAGQANGAMMTEYVDDVTVRGGTFAANVDRGNTGSVFYLHYGEDLVIADATFQDNLGGPPVWQETWSTATVTGSTFAGPGIFDRDYDTIGSRSGGGVYFNVVTDVVVEDSEFTGFQAANGAGIWNANYGGSADSSFRLARTTFHDNAGDQSIGFGVVEVGTVTVEDVVVEDNTSLGGTIGGGGSIHNASQVTVRRSVFRNNDTTNAGAGLYIGGNLTDAVIEDSTFEGNRTGVADTAGGGLYVEGNGGGGAVVRGSTFTANVGASVGAGAAIRGFSTVDVSTSVFAGNECADECTGAGLHVQDAEMVTVDRCEFLDNDAGDGTSGSGWGGAGLSAQAPHLVVLNSLFDDNVTSIADAGTKGSAIQFRPVPSNGTGPSSLDVVHGTFTGSRASDAHAITVNGWFMGGDAPVDVNVISSVVWGGPATGDHVAYYNSAWRPHPSGMDLTASHVQGTATEVDPLFTGASSDPYGAWRPGPGSPLVGAAPSDDRTPTDLEGTVRPTPSAIGALEPLP